MTVTILYLHHTTACWMQWRGGRLLRVYSESITREIADLAVGAIQGEVLPTRCSWLSLKSSKIRIVVDPVIDQTRYVPAFDFGFRRPGSWLEYFRRLAEQCYASCRALTCDVLADDLTRYRRDQLQRHPSALLQWHSPLLHAEPNTQSSLVPGWVLTESGLPDFVLNWLNSMAQMGLEFVDIRPVSSLFAVADASENCPVVTVWSEAHRWRCLVTAKGSLHRVEQWSNEADALMGAGQQLNQLREAGQEPILRFTGQDRDERLWQDIFSNTEYALRVDDVHAHIPPNSQHYDGLPQACYSLPCTALLQRLRPSSPGITARIDVGEMLRRLLSVSRWRKRRQHVLGATVVMAAFSGYFVLLTAMHALRVIDLHERVDVELQSINKQLQELELKKDQFHRNPDQALLSIGYFYEALQHIKTNDQQFLKPLAKLLQQQPDIVIHTVSWRPLGNITWGEDSLELLAQLPDLFNVESVSKQKSIDKDRVVLLSGLVAAADTQQQASEKLMQFLENLIKNEEVIEVMPITQTLSAENAVSFPAANFPSEISLSIDDPSAFLIMVKMRA